MFLASGIVLEISATHIKEEKLIKGIINRNTGVKLSIFADDTILHIERPKIFTKILSQVTHKFNCVVELNIHIQIYKDFYIKTNKKLADKEVVTVTQFTIATDNTVS